MEQQFSYFHAHLMDVFIRHQNTDIKTIIEDLYEELILTFQPELYLGNFDINWRTEINNICQSLIKAYELFNRGLIGDCYDFIFKSIFQENTPSKLGIETILSPHKCLFRMRDSNSRYLYNKMEMCHIPFNQRNKISNQRYSLSGFPCLYLGSSLYVCWEELNRPDFDNANCALFINTRNLKLLDLRFPDNIKSVSSLAKLVLAASCSVKSSATNDTFKPEYIIPQAILHSLIKHNSENRIDNKYDGIIYTSSTYWAQNKLWNDVNLFTNIVIPAVYASKSEIITINGMDYSTNIIDGFKIKGPTTYNIYDYKQESYTECDIQSCNLLYRDSQLNHDGYLSSKFHKLTSYLIANIN